ncbi:hypothetical protein [Allosphingosinicella indica]|uniref:SMP-30/Gluconolactonase/LRE-like region domain-containing protein n=1 Tax=Allosphingosinicella indica TaxID=941907 RepID=A0A1X7FZC3_9SPHN|nr:hypothetical protein [Allosphingosinicella indica]SMF61419.1 hypothetical protein SAMN06295910_0407 [Allosphingosinicella indica]
MRIVPLMLSAVMLVAATSPAPVSSGAVRTALLAAIEASDHAAVAARAALLAEMGATLSSASQDRIAPFVDADLRESLAARFAENAQPIAAATPFATLPPSMELVEGIAWDGRRLFAGSASNGRLMMYESRTWRELPLDAPPAGLFGMAVDVPRQRLWIAAGTTRRGAEAAEIWRGLIGVDLASHRIVERLAMPDGGSPGDVALAADGTLYASDGNGGLYRCKPGCATLERMALKTPLDSPQGIVPSPDGRSQIVADYVAGLVRIDPADGSVTPIGARTPMMLEGIDGLVAHGRDLIAIQNGTRPRRILRIALDDGGIAIRSVAAIEREPPGWDEPTLGVVAADALLYVADAQWTAVGEDGAVKPGTVWRATQIRRLPL